MSNPASDTLFIPLKKRFFEAFARGEKTTEFRRYSARWNERTCRIGRKVVISLGYGWKRRLFGTVVGFTRDLDPQSQPGWVECFGTGPAVAACIEIKLDEGQENA